jgi:hypothetical protein
MSILPLVAALLSVSGLVGCQVFAPSVESKTVWRVDVY